MQTQTPSSFSPDARFLLGLSQLSLSLANEVSDTVGTVHREIHRSTPLRWLPERMGIARHIYALLQKSLHVPAHLLGLAGQRFTPREVDIMTLHVQAAVNGVFGDTLVKQNNPLALSMSMHGDTPDANAPLLLFIHGLCLHEQRWQNAAHSAFTEDLRKQGFRVGYLRYNSGLPIADNARQLANLLETVPASQVALVGHSMGGLISRSALHQAIDAGHRWADKTSHLATLGSPHHGAGAERLGNYANRSLMLSRWSAPLVRLGNLRSASIHDLRFGSLLHSDRDRCGDVLHTHDPREPIPVPDNVAHYFLAATRSTENTDKALRSDMLVTPQSGLADNYPNSEAVTRELLYGIDHLQLLSDQAVYKKLGKWMELN